MSVEDAPQWMVCLLGAPGSGKGTQGQLLANHLGGVHVSVGDRVRERQAAGERIPRDRKSRLVETAYTLELIKSAVGTHAGPIVLDGFPRAGYQVPALLQLPWHCRLVVWLDLDFETSISRMKTRGRPGEDIKQIGMRHLNHEAAKAGLRTSLNEHGLTWVTIDSAGPIAAVQNSLIHTTCG